jgi:hypothetical protein
MIALEEEISACGDGMELAAEGTELPKEAISDVNVGLDRFSSIDCGAMPVEVNVFAKSSAREVFEISFAFRLYPTECKEESPDSPFGVLCLSGI